MAINPGTPSHPPGTSSDGIVSNGSVPASSNGPVSNGAVPALTASEGNATPELRVGSPEWHEKNERRTDLINKKYDEGLTEAERAELERLQTEVLGALHKAEGPPRLFAPELLKYLAAKTGQ